MTGFGSRNLKTYAQDNTIATNLAKKVSLPIFIHLQENSGLLTGDEAVSRKAYAGFSL